MGEVHHVNLRTEPDEVTELVPVVGFDDGDDPPGVTVSDIVAELEELVEMFGLPMLTRVDSIQVKPHFFLDGDNLDRAKVRVDLTLVTTLDALRTEGEDG